MSGAKRYMPIALACLFLSTTGSAFAGRSPLDMWGDVKSTSLKNPDGANSSQTFVSTPALDGNSMNEFLPKKVSEPKLPKVQKAHAKMSLPGFHNTHEPQQTAERPTPTHSKSALDQEPNGDGIMGKTKGFGEAIANSAKSSGGFFFKGAKAIGHTFKSGTAKMPSLPGLKNADEKEPPRVAQAKGPLPKIKPIFGQVSGNDDWKPTQAHQVTNQPAIGAANAPNKVAKQNDGGFFQKATGMIPFMGHKNKSLAGRDAPPYR